MPLGDPRNVAPSAYSGDGGEGALLDVAEAAREITSPDYRTAPEPYAQGVRLDDMRARNP